MLDEVTISSKQTQQETAREAVSRNPYRDMSNQDGGYGGGMALNDRVARQGQSHQTSHKGHVRASLLLLARLTILTLPLLTLFKFVQCRCQ